MTHTGERHFPRGTPQSGERPAPGVAPRAGLAQRVSLLGWSLVLLLGAALGFGLLTLWITSVTVVVLLVGIPLTLLSTVLVRWFADLHRQWAADRLGEPVARPYLPTPDGGWPMRLWAILRDPATWRDWAWLVANSITGWFTYGLSFLFFLCGVFYLSYPLLFALTPPQVFRTPLGNGFRLHSVQESFAMVPLGPVFLLLWYTTAERLAHLNALVIRSLLAPTAQAQLRARVAQLAASRAETVDTQAGELRRIERDLHDGAQARLVSLGMSLGLAEQLLPDDPQAVQQLLAEARASTSSALAELRDLVRGIHPPVLADRGLDGALQALALANPIHDGGHPSARTVARAGRVRGLLRRRRGPGERHQARPGPAHPDHRGVHAPSGHDGGVADDAGVRRRPRGRPSRRRHRPSGHRAPAGGLRRHADRRQSARRTHRDKDVAAVRIVIAEDLALLREGLIRIFQANGFEVVDAVDNGPSLTKALTTHRPDVAVVDVRLPPTFTDEGLRAVIDVRKRIPGLPIVVLSQYVEQLYARELMSDRAGAVGYLLKDRVLDVGQFVAGVRQVAAGSTVMDPDVVGALLTHRSADPLLRELTPREHEVLSLMAQGRSNAAIAGRMFVSEKTVSKHSYNIFTKLGLEPSEDDNRRILAVLAYLEG